MVRPGTPPAFWLRLPTADGARDIDLDVLDAVGLLVSRRMPAVVTAPTPPAD